MKKALLVAIYFFFEISIVGQINAGEHELSIAFVQNVLSESCRNHPYLLCAAFFGLLKVLDYSLEDYDESDFETESEKSAFLLKTLAAGLVLDCYANGSHSVPGNILWLVHNFNEQGAVMFLPWLSWQGIKKLCGY